MTKEEFWMLCDSILGIQTQKPINIRRRTRWNNREPGSGRYPGIGLIRYYSSEIIHITTHDENKTFSSCYDAIEFLKYLKLHQRE